MVQSIETINKITIISRWKVKVSMWEQFTCDRELPSIWR